jgi:hypothetical protein
MDPLSRRASDRAAPAAAGLAARWVRVLAGALLALFSLDRGRGKAGMDAIGILNRLHGFAVHDRRRT